MIQDTCLVKEINRVLSDNYPIKLNSILKLTDINKLKISFFGIKKITDHKYIPFMFDLDGNILSGRYTNYKIISVITNKNIEWQNFINSYVLCFSDNFNPYISSNYILYRLHKLNFINSLKIQSFVIKNKLDITQDCINYTVEYIDKNLLKLPLLKSIKINEENHFYITSFGNNNIEELKIEITRLYKNRDKFKSLHFHLENTQGHMLTFVNLIIRILTGKRESWMQNTVKIEKNSVRKWDPWIENEESSPKYHVFNRLKFDFDDKKYTNKYTGMVHVYSNNHSDMASWYFLTYLIYSFVKEDGINRFTKTCYGTNLKFGSINKNNKLIIHGTSQSFSKETHPIDINYKNIIIRVPTTHTDKCSIKSLDWNRFWIHN